MKLAIVGGGNMAAAMIGGLREHGADDVQILVVERERERRELLERDPEVRTQAAIDPELGQADIIVLAVKPADLREVCAGLLKEAPPARSGALLLSIAAGMPTDSIARWCGTEAVVRAMPNTPALIGQGITGLFARPGVSAAQRAAATRILAVLGDAFWMAEEAQLDVVTAISGSGPAYAFYYMEALQEAAVRMGLEAGQARHFAIQTFVGAAQLAIQSAEPLSALRERVTSKGGTTAAALASMERDKVADGIIAGANAALERSREMAREFGGD
jgi:pyrroline-5-carboxylate reductase